MAVLTRATSSTIGDNGEVISVIAENFQEPHLPFLLYPQIGEGDPAFKVQRNTYNQEKSKPRAWGAGTRVLFLLCSCERKPVLDWTPVIALTQNAEKAATPILTTVIESPIDPVLLFDPNTQFYHLFYWVNAWSPTFASTTSQGSLFPATDPPLPDNYDPSYYEDTLECYRIQQNL
jgi:hypothetical protein